MTYGAVPPPPSGLETEGTGPQSHSGVDTLGTSSPYAYSPPVSHTYEYLEEASPDPNTGFHSGVRSASHVATVGRQVVAATAVCAVVVVVGALALTTFGGATSGVGGSEGAYIHQLASAVASLAAQQSETAATYVTYSADACTVNCGGDELAFPHEVYSKDGMLEYTLEVNTFRYEGPISVNMRAYDGKVAGPTLVASPGDKVTIHLKNSLESTASSSDSTSWFSTMSLAELSSESCEATGETNSTSLHFHGLLLPSSTYEAWDGSDKLATPGGGAVTYEFSIPADHPSGTFAYYSHYKGVQSMQSAGFMMGAFIVRDVSGPFTNRTKAGALYHEVKEVQEHYTTSAAREYGLAPALWEEMVASTTPDESKWPSDWTESYQVMMFQWGSFTSSAVDFNALTMCGESDMPVDVVSYMDVQASAEFASVNGVYQPSVEIHVGEWARWRVVNGASHRYLSLSGFPDTCEAYAISTDGVYLDSPRQLDSFFVKPSGRADLLVRCFIHGDVTMSSGSEADLAAADAYYGAGAVSLYGGDLMTLSVKDIAFEYDEDEQPRLAKNAYTHLNLESALLDTLPTGWFGVDHTNLTSADCTANEVDVSAKGDTATTTGLVAMAVLPSATTKLNVDMTDSEAVKRLELGEPQEWTIKHADGSTKSQTFYLHGLHFQIMSAAAADGLELLSSPTGDWQAGDWLDLVVVPAGGYVVVRFTPTLYEDAARASYCGMSCTSFEYFGTAA